MNGALLSAEPCAARASELLSLFDRNYPRVRELASRWRHPHVITEEEFSATFEQVMRDWGHRPWRYGQVPLPSRQEARQALERSRYNQ